MSKRKKYPKEFKLDAVSLVSEQGCTRTEAAKSLGINCFKSSAAREVDPERLEMLEWVKDIDQSSKHSYSSRRMKRAMNALGFPISRSKAR